MCNGYQVIVATKYVSSQNKGGGPSDNVSRKIKSEENVLQTKEATLNLI